MLRFLFFITVIGLILLFIGALGLFIIPTIIVTFGIFAGVIAAVVALVVIFFLFLLCL